MSTNKTLVIEAYEIWRGLEYAGKLAIQCPATQRGR